MQRFATGTDAALTLIGVASLFEPSHLVEIEAVAVVDDPPAS